MRTATVDLREGFVVGTAAAIASCARVVVRTDVEERVSGCDPALTVFRDIDAACSLLDPESDLSRVNAAPDEWHVVSPACFTALREAWWGFRRTSGRFDPRLRLDAATPPPAGWGLRLPWRPRMLDATRSVHIGGIPIELDGIARGLALRWASNALGGTHHLVEVGDDCWCSGRCPDGGPWRVGIADPGGDPTPLAVLALSDTACITSTRSPIGTGAAPGDVLAATVLGPDPVAAAVWSRVLLLAGAEGIAQEAGRRRLAAAWVTADGVLHVNSGLEPRILWQR